MTSISNDPIIGANNLNQKRNEYMIHNGCYYCWNDYWRNHETLYFTEINNDKLLHPNAYIITTPPHFVCSEHAGLKLSNEECLKIMKEQFTRIKM
jgi:hypothetical protein